MIIKSFELETKITKKNKNYLLYGVNQGHIEETVNKILKPILSKNIFNYEEIEVLKDINRFKENIFNRSFFDDSKLIIINRCSDKIYSIVQEIILENLDNINLILLSKVLEKKSKLRALFEKSTNAICIPFYEDTNQTLSTIALNYFNSKKIKISREIINIIVERAKGDRINLKNELEKIDSLILTKKKITAEDISKLTNLCENYSISELVDNSLLKNKFKLIKILNENNFGSDDCIIILRTFLAKLKRLKKIHNEIIKNKKTIDDAISSFKPPIFWKEKEVIKQQIQKLSYKNTNDLIFRTNEIEFLSKRNPQISINLTTDFMVNGNNH